MPTYPGGDSMAEAMEFVRTGPDAPSPYAGPRTGADRIWTGPRASLGPLGVWAVAVCAAFLGGAAIWGVIAASGRGTSMDGSPAAVIVVSALAAATALTAAWAGLKPLSNSARDLPGWPHSVTENSVAGNTLTGNSATENGHPMAVNRVPENHGAPPAAGTRQDDVARAT